MGKYGYKFYPENLPDWEIWHLEKREKALVMFMLLWRDTKTTYRRKKLWEPYSCMVGRIAKASRHGVGSIIYFIIIYFLGTQIIYMSNVKKLQFSWSLHYRNHYLKLNRWLNKDFNWGWAYFCIPGKAEIWEWLLTFTANLAYREGTPVTKWSH